MIIQHLWADVAMLSAFVDLYERYHTNNSFVIKRLKRFILEVICNAFSTCLLCPSESHKTGIAMCQLLRETWGFLTPSEGPFMSCELWLTILHTTKPENAYRTRVQLVSSQHCERACLMIRMKLYQNMKIRVRRRKIVLTANVLIANHLEDSCLRLNPRTDLQIGSNTTYALKVSCLLKKYSSYSSPAMEKQAHTGAAGEKNHQNGSCMTLLRYSPRAYVGQRRLRIQIVSSLLLAWIRRPSRA